MQQTTGFLKPMSIHESVRVAYTRRRKGRAHGVEGVSSAPVGVELGGNRGTRTAVVGSERERIVDTTKYKTKKLRYNETIVGDMDTIEVVATPIQILTQQWQLFVR